MRERRFPSRSACSPAIGPSQLQITGVICAVGGVLLASHERHEGSLRIAAGVGLALLAALGFGGYFLPMHAAGQGGLLVEHARLPHDDAPA